MSARDPQATTGIPPRPAEPDCTCGHPLWSHAFGRRGGVPVRTTCTRHDPDPCGCTTYQPEPDASDG